MRYYKLQTYYLVISKNGNSQGFLIEVCIKVEIY